MSVPNIIGIAVLLLSLAGSRVIAERAVRLLSDQEKLLLINSFSGIRAWGSLPFIGVVAVFFVSGYLRGWWVWAGFSIGWLLLTTYFAWTHQIIFRKFRELQVSAAYQIRFARSRQLIYGGFVIFFVCMVLPLFLH